MAEPELLLQLSRHDDFHVAPEYGLKFPEYLQPLNSNDLTEATQAFMEKRPASFTGS